MQQSMYNYI